MTEEMKPGEMSEQEQPEQKPTEMVSVSAAELAEIRAALKKANAEAAKYRKTAEQIEQERKAKEEAEMTALEKANKRAADLEAQIKQMERSRMQSEIAAKVGLPAKLANRLQGETPEEMEADARAILEDLPKPQEAHKPGPGLIVNPGVNGKTGETDAERRKRLFG